MRSLSQRAFVVLAAVVAAAILVAAVLARPTTRQPDGEQAAPTQEPTATSLPTRAAPAPSSTPTASPEPGVAVAWLIDVRSGSVKRLAETTRYIVSAGFAPSGTELALGVAEGVQDTLSLQRFDLTGRQLERAAWTGSPYRSSSACAEIRSAVVGPPAPGDPPTLVEVGGRRFEGATCGPVSPDGRRMTYWVWASRGSDSAPWYVDQWVIDLSTGDRRLLQQGLQHCGGCDSVPGPRWSASGRFLYFSDVVAGGGRFFLADALMGTARPLTGHVPRGPFDVPQWSPVADLILYSNNGATVMEDFAAGSSAALSGVPWPAAFDPSGAYVHSPGWVDDEASGRVTTVFEVGSRRIVASLPGQPVPRTFVGIGGPPDRARPIAAVPGGFVAALQNVPGCDGVAIYRGPAVVTCVARASRPEISPDGSRVALAHWTAGQTAPDRCVPACAPAEIVVIDAATGSELMSTGDRLRLTLSYGRATDPSSATSYIWSQDSAHLLVVGPPAR